MRMFFLCLFFLDSVFSNKVAHASDLSGKLIYANGTNIIRSLDLSTLKHEILHKEPFGIFINNLSKITETRFIYQDCDGTRKPGCLLQEFDIENKSVKTWRSGHIPTYVKESNSIFFYESAPDTGEEWLFVVNLEAIGNAKKVMRAPSTHKTQNGIPYSYKGPVVQISPDQVIFVGEDDGIWIYQISNSKLISTDIKNIRPIFWLDKTKELIGYNWESKGIVRYDLKSKRIEQLPQFKASSGFVYIPNYDTVISWEGRLHFFISERFDIFSYHLGSGERMKIVPNHHISSGIWFQK